MAQKSRGAPPGLDDSDAKPFLEGLAWLTRTRVVVWLGEFIFRRVGQIAVWAGVECTLFLLLNDKT